MSDTEVQNAKYATLSYCWGDTETAQFQSKTTWLNLRERVDGIDKDSLSPVIQDAIEASTYHPPDHTHALWLNKLLHTRFAQGCQFAIYGLMHCAFCKGTMKERLKTGTVKASKCIRSSETRSSPSVLPPREAVKKAFLPSGKSYQRCTFVSRRLGDLAQTPLTAYPCFLRTPSELCTHIKENG